MKKTRILFIGIKESYQSYACLTSLYGNQNIEALTPILFSLEKWLNKKSKLKKLSYLLRKVTIKQILRYIFSADKNLKNKIYDLKNDPQIISSMGELKKCIANYRFDFALVCSFPFKIGKDIRKTAKVCFLNLHANDIQCLRGEFPIEAAILEKKTLNAVSLHVMTDEFDSGRLLSKKTYKISDCYSLGQIIERNSNALRDIILNIDKYLDKKNIQKKEEKTEQKKGKFVRVSWIKRNLIDLYIIKNFSTSYLRKFIKK